MEHQQPLSVTALRMFHMAISMLADKSAMPFPHIGLSLCSDERKGGITDGFLDS
jgi:hypothetical protein